MHHFFDWADAQPERTVLTQADSGETYTAGDIARGARRAAQWMAAQGLQAHSTVAVLLENRREIVELVLAAREAGLYAAVISTHLTPAEVAYIVKDSGAQMPVALQASPKVLKNRCWARSIDRKLTRK